MCCDKGNHNWNTWTNHFFLDQHTLAVHDESGCFIECLIPTGGRGIAVLWTGRVSVPSQFSSYATNIHVQDLQIIAFSGLNLTIYLIIPSCMMLGQDKAIINKFLDYHPNFLKNRGGWADFIFLIFIFKKWGKQSCNV